MAPSSCVVIIGRAGSVSRDVVSQEVARGWGPVRVGVGQGGREARGRDGVGG